MPQNPLTDKTILVTGAAGFIGANLALRLLKEVPQVNLIGLDSVNDYYDVSIRFGNRLTKRPTLAGPLSRAIWRTRT